ncbi:MAG: hypothetical protein RLZZ292_3660 [Bacteroidota bacterium]|jgi:DNA adenine methylase
MGHYGGYTEKDFGDLLQHCEEMQGKFLLSSYPSTILEEYTTRNGWFTVSIHRKCSASKNRKDKIEVLTANYPISLPDKK